MESSPSSYGFVLIHILGAAQGVFLAAILASRRPGSVANNVLAVLMLALGFDLGIAVYHATGFDAVFPHLIGADYPLVLLYGPLIYLYARLLSNQEVVFKSGYLWHVLPFALLVLFLAPFYLQSGAEKLAFLHDPEPGLWTQVLEIVNHVKIVHALTYIGLTLALLRRHRHRIRDTFSFTERINLLWLRNLMVGIVAVAGVAVMMYLLSLGAPPPVIGLDPASVYDDYTLLGTALFVYAIGFMGLRQPEIFGRGRTRILEPQESSTKAAPSQEPAQPSEKPRYARSGMDPDTATHYKQALLERMETDKLYRRGDLTLQDLSDALSISPHNLTEVINTQLGQNFYDFVNGYRVQEVQERLADPTQAHLTLLALGLEAGFNSKSSFNAVFKKHTKMTPSQYRRTLVDEA